MSDRDTREHRQSEIKDLIAAIAGVASGALLAALVLVLAR